jgi:CubicO group peptidase (beta-lactamase class C family)
MATRLHHLLWLAIAISIAVATTAHAQAGRSSFDRRFEGFVERLRQDPSAPPGFAIVVVERSNTVFERAYGTRDLRTNDPLTLDAPIFTASTTKSFVGLLAAQLDAAGILPLSATMRDVWPTISLPPPLDPAKVTARAFLSHVSGIESPVLGWRYSDTGEYRSEEVPAILSQYAVVANRAFDYGNIGPVIYSAMAEARLKQSWRDALQQYVVRPLKLKHMSARLEDFAPAEIAQCHARWGGRWRVAPQKPTVLLDAGGGVLASARDAGIYLKAFTSDGQSTGGAISAAVLRETYKQAATQDRDFLGFHRTGYGLGWDLSEYGPHKVVSRSGGYPGCRSIMIFLPAERFGVLVFSLSDAGANLFGTTVAQQAVDYWTNDPRADSRAADRLSTFAIAAANSIREADAVPIMPEDRTAGVSPDYVGWYESAGRGCVAVSMHPDGMEAAAGALRLLLVPEGKDQFAAYDASVPSLPRPLKFRRNAVGAIDAFIYREVTFLKRAAH